MNVNFNELQYNKLKDAAGNITSNNGDADDLLHECLLVLYEKGEEFVNELIEKKALQFYCVRIMLNMYNSKTSKYHYKYRFEKKFVFEFLYWDGVEDYAPTNKNVLTPTIQELRNQMHNQFIDDCVEQMHEILNELYWYDAELFKLYKFGSNDGKRWTLNSLAKKTGISRTSIFDTTNRVMKYISKRMKEETKFLNYEI